MSDGTESTAHLVKNSSEDISVTLLQYICETCDKMYTDFISYQTHLKSHSVYNCMKCPQSFSSKELLNQHKEIKHSDVILSCEYCGKTYNNKNSFTRHKKSHTHKFCCMRCHHYFKEKEDLTKHNLSKHPEKCLKR